MRIAFITNEGFPSGMATTNRILSLALGLVEIGNDVTIFCVRPTEKKGKRINTNVEGSHKGVKYVYTAGTIDWPSSKIQKFLISVKGFLGFFKHYRNISKFNFVICTTSSILSNYYYTKLFKRDYTVALLAVDEYPHVVRNKLEYPKVFAKLYLKYFYRLFDGLIVMTRPLMGYYEKLIRDNAIMVHIPMTVEVERFLNVDEKSPIAGDYIAYCGNLGQNEKDGVPILIRAFSSVHKKFPNIKLVIIGGTNPSIQEQTLNKLKELTQSLNIEHNVVFTGKVHRDEIPKYLFNARLLALARPESLQAQGGFPTKLGEYLATGVPVVVTKVGEIPYYLSDGINAFLAEPNNVDDFALKLLAAFQNYESSMKMGIKGQNIAKEIFNYKVQSKYLNGYLDNFAKQ